ncbi:MAG: PTS glucose transporter subunit IIBC, partial [Pseudomonadota bacterium]
FQRAFGFLQKIGKALMLPVAVLPAAGILLGVGASEEIAFIPEVVKSVMDQAGGAIFSNLPILFAIGVALGLTNNDGVAALAATVGYAVFLGALGTIAGAMGVETKAIMGIQSLDTGVFGGILIGGVAAALFNRYYRIQLPPWLGFFAGKRFVPIATAFAAIACAGLMAVIWPPIEGVIRDFSNQAAYGNQRFAVTVYGFVERLLIPFGLHHIWNVPFFFEIGEFVTPEGEVVRGDLSRFLKGDPEAGILGGAYLFKMWGLPAAAIAIWHCAKPERRALVGSIMISAALTSFITGITEPVEFSFLFVAPILFVLHAILAGAAQFMFNVLDVHMGTTFSHGLIDLVVLWGDHQKPWMVFVIGPVYAVMYYLIFRFAITRFDLKTPGREDEEVNLVAAQADAAEGMSRQLVLAFGGRSNIESMDACITRLRISVKDIALVNETALKTLGAAGLVVVGNNAQAIFGPSSENLKTDMEAYLAHAGDEADDIGSLGVPVAAAAAPETPAAARDPAAGEKVQRWLDALGGAANVTAAAACAQTRVRVTVADVEAIDAEALAASGVDALMTLADGVLHLVVGLNADQYATEMQAQLA